MVSIIDPLKGTFQEGALNPLLWVLASCSKGRQGGFDVAAYGHISERRGDVEKAKADLLGGFRGSAFRGLGGLAFRDPKST